MQPLVGVIMGSKSDWETMQHATNVLAVLDVPHEVRVVSAHRTPDLLFSYAREAEARGLEVIIAGAGGAAHLPGMTAALTTLPVLGVPMAAGYLQGMDALLSIVQMPAGVPVGTLAIGKAGAINAALLAVAILANKHAWLREPIVAWREKHRVNVRRRDPVMSDEKQMPIWKVAVGPVGLLGRTVQAWTKGEARALLKSLRATGKLPAGLVLARAG